MICSKYVASSLVMLTLLTFSVIAQSSNEKKPVTKNEAVEIQSNFIKSITYPTSPLVNTKMATVQPSTLIKRATLKAKNEDHIKLKSKTIKK